MLFGQAIILKLQSKLIECTLHFFIQSCFGFFELRFETRLETVDPVAEPSLRVVDPVVELSPDRVVQVKLCSKLGDLSI